MTAQSPGTLIDLGTLGGTMTTPVGVNDLGEVVGWSYLAGDLHGVVTDLGRLGGEQAAAVSVNRFGQISGLAQASDGVHYAATWTNAVIRNLGGSTGTNAFNVANWINDSGEAAGTWATAWGPIPMFWDVAGNPFPLPMLGTTGSAFAANNIRQIAGTTGGSAVVWQGGSPVDLETLIPGTSLAGAYGINNVGQVVGGRTRYAVS